MKYILGRNKQISESNEKFGSLYPFVETTVKAPPHSIMHRSYYN
jgi:hypothetical protein